MTEEEAEEGNDKSDVSCKVVAKSNLTSVNNWNFVSQALEILVPLLSSVFLWRRRDILERLFLEFDKKCVSVLYPSLSRRENLLKWTERALTPSWMSSLNLSLTLADIWKDGSLLCSLINSTIPGACPNPHRHRNQPPVHGQALAYKYFGIAPVFSNEDFAEPLHGHLETTFFLYLCRVRAALNKVDAESFRELKYVSSYIVRGMGLVAGEQYRKSVFYIYPNSRKNEDGILITIKGPFHAYGSISLSPFYICKSSSPNTGRKQFIEAIREVEKLTQKTKAQKHFFQSFVYEAAPFLKRLRSVSVTKEIPIEANKETDRIKVTYVPQHSGIHILCIITDGCHLQGSPFSIFVVENKSVSRGAELFTRQANALLLRASRKRGERSFKKRVSVIEESGEDEICGSPEGESGTCVGKTDGPLIVNGLASYDVKAKHESEVNLNESPGKTLKVDSQLGMVSKTCGKSYSNWEFSEEHTVGNKLTISYLEVNDIKNDMKMDETATTKKQAVSSNSTTKEPLRRYSESYKVWKPLNEILCQDGIQDINEDPLKSSLDENCNKNVEHYNSTMEHAFDEKAARTWNNYKGVLTFYDNASDINVRITQEEANRKDFDEVFYDNQEIEINYENRVDNYLSSDLHLKKVRTSKKNKDSEIREEKVENLHENDFTAVEYFTHLLDADLKTLERENLEKLQTSSEPVYNNDHKTTVNLEKQSSKNDSENSGDTNQVVLLLRLSESELLEMPPEKHDESCIEDKKLVHEFDKMSIKTLKRCEVLQTSSGSIYNEMENKCTSKETLSNNSSSASPFKSSNNYIDHVPQVFQSERKILDISDDNEKRFGGKNNDFEHKLSFNRILEDDEASRTIQANKNFKNENCVSKGNDKSTSHENTSNVFSFENSNDTTSDTPDSHVILSFKFDERDCRKILGDDEEFHHSGVVFSNTILENKSNLKEKNWISNAKDDENISNANTSQENYAVQHIQTILNSKGSTEQYIKVNCLGDNNEMIETAPTLDDGRVLQYSTPQISNTVCADKGSFGQENWMEELKVDELSVENDSSHSYRALQAIFSNKPNEKAVSNAFTCQKTDNEEFFENSIILSKLDISEDGATFQYPVESVSNIIDKNSFNESSCIVETNLNEPLLENYNDTSHNNHALQAVSPFKSSKRRVLGTSSIQENASEKYLGDSNKVSGLKLPQEILETTTEFQHSVTSPSIITITHEDRIKEEDYDDKTNSDTLSLQNNSNAFLLEHFYDVSDDSHTSSFKLTESKVLNFKAKIPPVKISKNGMEFHQITPPISDSIRINKEDLGTFGNTSNISSFKNASDTFYDNYDLPAISSLGEINLLETETDGKENLEETDKLFESGLSYNNVLDSGENLQYSIGSASTKVHVDENKSTCTDKNSDPSFESIVNSLSLEDSCKPNNNYGTRVKNVSSDFSEHKTLKTLSGEGNITEDNKSALIGANNQSIKCDSGIPFEADVAANIPCIEHDTPDTCLEAKRNRIIRKTEELSYNTLLDLMKSGRVDENFTGNKESNYHQIGDETLSEETSETNKLLIKTNSEVIASSTTEENRFDTDKQERKEALENSNASFIKEIGGTLNVVKTAEVIKEFYEGVVKKENTRSAENERNFQRTSEDDSDSSENKLLDYLDDLRFSEIQEKQPRGETATNTCKAIHDDDQIFITRRAVDIIEEENRFYKQDIDITSVGCNYMENKENVNEQFLFDEKQSKQIGNENVSTNLKNTFKNQLVTESSVPGSTEDKKHKSGTNLIDQDIEFLDKKRNLVPTIKEECMEQRVNTTYTDTHSIKFRGRANTMVDKDEETLFSKTKRRRCYSLQGEGANGNFLGITAWKGQGHSSRAAEMEEVKDLVKKQINTYNSNSRKNSCESIKQNNNASESFRSNVIADKKDNTEVQDPDQSASCYTKMRKPFYNSLEERLEAALLKCSINEKERTLESKIDDNQKEEKNSNLIVTIMDPYIPVRTSDRNNDHKNETLPLSERESDTDKIINHKIVAENSETWICGDNYQNSHQNEAGEIKSELKGPYLNFKKGNQTAMAVEPENANTTTTDKISLGKLNYFDTLKTGEPISRNETSNRSNETEKERIKAFYEISKINNDHLQRTDENDEFGELVWFNLQEKDFAKRDDSKKRERIIGKENIILHTKGLETFGNNLRQSLNLKPIVKNTDDMARSITVKEGKGNVGVKQLKVNNEILLNENLDHTNAFKTEKHNFITNEQTFTNKSTNDANNLRNIEKTIKNSQYESLATVSKEKELFQTEEVNLQNKSGNQGTSTGNLDLIDNAINIFTSTLKLDIKPSDNTTENQNERTKYLTAKQESKSEDLKAVENVTKISQYESLISVWKESSLLQKEEMNLQNSDRNSTVHLNHVDDVINISTSSRALDVKTSESTTETLKGATKEQNENGNLYTETFSDQDSSDTQLLLCKVSVEEAQQNYPVASSSRNEAESRFENAQAISEETSNETKTAVSKVYICLENHETQIKRNIYSHIYGTPVLKEFEAPIISEKHHRTPIEIENKDLFSDSNNFETTNKSKTYFVVESKEIETKNSRFTNHYHGSKYVRKTIKPRTQTVEQEITNDDKYFPDVAGFVKDINRHIYSDYPKDFSASRRLSNCETPQCILAQNKVYVSSHTNSSLPNICLCEQSNIKTGNIQTQKSQSFDVNLNFSRIRSLYDSEEWDNDPEKFQRNILRFKGPMKSGKSLEEYTETEILEAEITENRKRLSDETVTRSQSVDFVEREFPSVDDKRANFEGSYCNSIKDGEYGHIKKETSRIKSEGFSNVTKFIEENDRYLSSHLNSSLPNICVNEHYKIERRNMWNQKDKSFNGNVNLSQIRSQLENQEYYYDSDEHIDSTKNIRRKKDYIKEPIILEKYLKTKSPETFDFEPVSREALLNVQNHTEHPNIYDRRVSRSQTTLDLLNEDYFPSIKDIRSKFENISHRATGEGKDNDIKNEISRMNIKNSSAISRSVEDVNYSRSKDVSVSKTISTREPKQQILKHVNSNGPNTFSNELYKTKGKSLSSPEIDFSRTISQCESEECYNNVKDNVKLIEKFQRNLDCFKGPRRSEECLKECSEIEIMEAIDAEPTLRKKVQRNLKYLSDERISRSQPSLDLLEENFPSIKDLRAKFESTSRRYIRENERDSVKNEVFYMDIRNFPDISGFDKSINRHNCMKYPKDFPTSRRFSACKPLSQSRNTVCTSYHASASLPNIFLSERSKTKTQKVWTERSKSLEINLSPISSRYENNHDDNVRFIEKSHRSRNPFKKYAKSEGSLEEDSEDTWRGSMRRKHMSDKRISRSQPSLELFEGFPSIKDLRAKFEGQIKVTNQPETHYTTNERKENSVNDEIQAIVREIKEYFKDTLEETSQSWNAPTDGVSKSEMCQQKRAASSRCTTKASFKESKIPLRILDDSSSKSVASKDLQLSLTKKEVLRLGNANYTPFPETKAKRRLTVFQEAEVRLKRTPDKGITTKKRTLKSSPNTLHKLNERISANPRTKEMVANIQMKYIPLSFHEKPTNKLTAEDQKNSFKNLKIHEDQIERNVYLSKGSSKLHRQIGITHSRSSCGRLFPESGKISETRQFKKRLIPSQRDADVQMKDTRSPPKGNSREAQTNPSKKLNDVVKREERDEEDEESIKNSMKDQFTKARSFFQNLEASCRRQKNADRMGNDVDRAVPTRKRELKKRRHSFSSGDVKRKKAAVIGGSLPLTPVSEKFSINNIYRDVLGDKKGHGSFKGAPNRYAVADALASVPVSYKQLYPRKSDDSLTNFDLFYKNNKIKRRKSLKSIFDIHY